MAQLSAAFGGATPPARDLEAEQIVEAWNLMGGEIAWAALPVVCELLDVENPELLIRGLAQIRDHYREVNSAEADH